jgi:DNA (cytosine-5)-methyltransferase 1
MSVSYNKLWKQLIDRKMNKTQLMKAAGVSTNVIARLGKDKPVSFDSLIRICNAINCDIGDIVEVERERTKEAIR